MIIEWFVATSIQTSLFQYEVNVTPTGRLSPALVLHHELGHAHHFNFVRKWARRAFRHEDSQYTNMEEYANIKAHENVMANVKGQGIRNTHYGQLYDAANITTTQSKQEVLNKVFPTRRKLILGSEGRKGF